MGGGPYKNHFLASKRSFMKGKKIRRLNLRRRPAVKGTLLPNDTIDVQILFVIGRSLVRVLRRRFCFGFFSFCQHMRKQHYFRSIHDKFPSVSSSNLYEHLLTRYSALLTQLNKASFNCLRMKQNYFDVT